MSNDASHLPIVIRQTSAWDSLNRETNRATAPRKRVIFVLGPPRTGTSVISSVLSRLGVDFGDERHFLDTNIHRHNPKGFFELTCVNQLNDEIFSRFGASWGEFDFHSMEQFNAPEFRQSEPKILELVQKEWGPGVPLIGIKDPRITLLFPLWKSVFLGMGYEVICLITLRHPLGHLASSGNFNLQTPPEGHLLQWARHLLDALYFSQDCDTEIVDFDAFVSGPQDTIGQLCQWLGITDIDRDEVADVLDKTLYHHHYTDSKTTSPFVNRLYDSFKASIHNRNSLNWVIEFYQSFLSLWPLIKSQNDVERRGALSVLSAQLAESEQAMSALSAELAKREAELVRIKGSLGWRLLSLYGRIKYPFLLPIYKLFGANVSEPATKAEAVGFEPKAGR